MWIISQQKLLEKQVEPYRAYFEEYAFCVKYDKDDFGQPSKRHGSLGEQCPGCGTHWVPGGPCLGRGGRKRGKWLKVHLQWNQGKIQKTDTGDQSGSTASWDLSPRLPVSWSHSARGAKRLPLTLCLLLLSPRGHTPIPSPHHLHLPGPAQSPCSSDSLSSSEF